MMKKANLCFGSFVVLFIGIFLYMLSLLSLEIAHVTYIKNLPGIKHIQHKKMLSIFQTGEDGP